MVIEIRAEVLGCQFLIDFEGNRSLDDVLKLADIAGVFIVEEQLETVCGDIGNRFIQLP
jgi:hypothetical protein